MSLVLTKVGEEVFAPTDGLGVPRSPSLQEAQVWSTEIEDTLATAAQTNADGGITSHSTTTTQNWDNGLYGGPFLAAYRLSSADDALFNGSRATFAVDRKVQGSGTNGPAYADLAAYLSVSKKNYYTNPTQGEIDGLEIFVGQSQLGDAGGILVDLEKVGGSTGAGVGVETAVKKIDNTGATAQRIQSIVNFGVESPGGPSISTGYGYWTEAEIGGVYSAFHADQSKAATGALWQNLMTFCEDRDAAKMIYRIDGSGHVLTKPGTQGSPAYSFLLDPDTGLYRLGADQVGLSTGGAVRVYAANSGVIPGADNAYTLGAATVGRWSNIYTVNAVTVGSDRRLKTEIIDTPLGLDFILALRPKAYKLLHGGTEIQMVDEEVEVEEAILDANGEPVCDRVPYIDAKGKEAVRLVPQMQTVTKVVQRPVEVKVPGKRQHFGLIAQEVLEALNGVDFGGHVLADKDDPDSQQSLRYEQFIPILIKAVQELKAANDNLAAEVAVLRRP
jgi:hypothetical protein